MTDRPAVEETFDFVTDASVPANQHMTHHFRNDEIRWYVIVQWITPDALPKGTTLHFALSLLPDGMRGVVQYTTPLGSKRVLTVHVDRPGLQ